MTALTEGHIRANGIDFGYLECGEGPLALCLHGFPDTAWGWRHLLPELAAAGFHAVAPFLRGYAPTALAPDGNYQIGALVADACALHEGLGGGSDAVLVGHDWGAMTAYGAAASAPERWARVVTAAVPPMPIAAGAMMSYDQIRRSFYIFFFQSALADVVVSMNDLDFIARLWADWSPGYDAAEDMVHVRAAIGQPANLAAAIGYYRAMLDTSGNDPAYADAQNATALPTPQPTLYLHGGADGCLGVEFAANAAAFFPAEGSRVEIVEGAGHFLHLEQPDLVNKLVVDFVTA